MKTRDVVVGLLVALFLAIAISPFASSSPDGLERVAEDKGFLEKGEGHEAISSPVPDYAMPGIENKTLATSAGGAAGTIAVFGLGVGAASLIRRRQRTN